MDEYELVIDNGETEERKYLGAISLDEARAAFRTERKRFDRGEIYSVTLNRVRFGPPFLIDRARP